jgi:hypothetical protein
MALFDLVDFGDLAGMFALAPEQGRISVREMECMLEEDRLWKQAALGTSRQDGERLLAKSEYMKSRRGQNCWQSVLTRNCVMARTMRGLMTLSPSCSPRIAGESTSWPLALSTLQV